MNQSRVNAAIAELKGMIEGLTQRLIDVSGDLAEAKVTIASLEKQIEELKEDSKTEAVKSNEGDGNA